MKEKVERNLKATALAFSALKTEYRRGADSQKLLKAFLKSLEDTLGSYDIEYDYLVGADTVRIDGKSENRVLKPGDAILLDASVGKDGVWSDVCRTFFVEEPTEKQREIFGLVKLSLRCGEKVLKNGVSAEDIYFAANARYEETGKTLVHHAGHRIGEGALLPPQFLKGNKTRIRSGDLVTVETGLYREFGIRLENDYFVKEFGAENLFEKFMPLNIEEYIIKS